MTFDEFYKLVQKDVPEASAERVRTAIAGFEDHLDEGLVRSTIKELRSSGGIVIASNEIAPSPPSRPAKSPSLATSATANRTPAQKRNSSKSGKQAVADLVTSQDALLVEASDRIQERTREKVASKLDSAVERVSDVLATSQMEVLDGLENFMLNQFGSQAVLAIAQGTVDQILEGEVVE